MYAICVVGNFLKVILMKIKISVYLNTKLKINQFDNFQKVEEIIDAEDENEHLLHFSKKFANLENVCDALTVFINTCEPVVDVPLHAYSRCMIKVIDYEIEEEKVNFTPNPHGPHTHAFNRGSDAFIRIKHHDFTKLLEITKKH